ncbi:MAG: glycoside hydrolase family 32 protein [Gemmatimonadota bacterium]|nr:MAG: glycoside hydrolase family 32 protein [Gemmatimonadota bacterium]
MTKVSAHALYAIVTGCLVGACVERPATDDTASSTYTERHRPRFHFSPPEKWMNDPNGMVYYDGEYHLFYQHYPDSTVWGPMHWGHAVSTDLVHWQHLPIALYPDELGYIFSGSAVVDWGNTTGFGSPDNPPLAAVFTYHSVEGERAGRTNYQTQGIAYSTDRGRTWTKYTGNPVIANPGIRDFRDPKVIWHEDSGQWVMVLAAYDHVQLWGSADLKSWEHLSDFGREWGAHEGAWECPDLFPMTVEGTGEEKWVLLQSLNPGGPNGGSGTQYFVGDFDGRYFTLDPAFAADVDDRQGVWLDYGRDNYAGVTWSDVPAADGRRLFLGWMSNWNYAQVVPTVTWRNAMTVPRSLKLRNTVRGYRLFTHPVEELQALRTVSYALAPETIAASLDITERFVVVAAQAELTLEIEWRPDLHFGIELSNEIGDAYRIGYRAPDDQFYSDRTGAGRNDFSTDFAASVHTAPRQVQTDTLRLHLLIDVASVELFADDGATVMTETFFPREDFTRIRLYSEGGDTRLIRGSVHSLRTIWNR